MRGVTCINNLPKNTYYQFHYSGCIEDINCAGARWIKLVDGYYYVVATNISGELLAFLKLQGTQVNILNVDTFSRCCITMSNYIRSSRFCLGSGGQ